MYLVTPSGEVLLKSESTRRRMIRLLVECIRDALSRRGLSLLEARVDGARLLLWCSGEPLRVLAALSRVFGVQYAASTVSVEFKSLDQLAEIVERYYSSVVSGKKFAVRVHRHGSHNFTSLDAARVIGAKLKPYSSGVDLENPDVEVFVEIRGWRAYLYTSSERVKGPSGLPLGSEGTALVLFSGGIDSPVAAWMTAKRGVRVDFLHAVVSSPASIYYSLRVAKRLALEWLHAYNPKLIIVDVAKLVYEATRRLPRRLWMLVFKKLLYSVGDYIASTRGYDAIVTGESIGQTSSQTLANLAVLHRVVATLKPIIRPLAGMDKLEIEEQARRIGVYEEASKTPEYSALARRGATPRASLSDAKILEEVKPVKPRILAELNLLEDDWSRVLEVMPLELDYVPADALIVGIEEAKNVETPTPRPVVIVYTSGDERREALNTVKQLRSKGVNAYLYHAESLREAERARIRIEPGEGVPQPRCCSSP